MTGENRNDDTKITVGLEFAPIRPKDHRRDWFRYYVGPERSQWYPTRNKAMDALCARLKGATNYRLGPDRQVKP